MGTYPFDEYHRVTLVPAIEDITQPQLVELADGIDITCDLTKEGLSLPINTEEITRERWHNPLIGKDPGRYDVNGPQLIGKRRVQGDDEPLYNAAIFRGSSFLVVRRGVLYEVPHANGHIVEVLGIRFGMPFTVSSAANARVTFIVPLFVNAYERVATIGGIPPVDYILEEDGDPLLEEDGDPFIEE